MKNTVNKFVQRKKQVAREPSDTPSNNLLSLEGNFSNEINATLSSNGQPLNAEMQSVMESGFGHSFEQVRIHTDSKAAKTAKLLNAKAYTVGQNIVFDDGQFNPFSKEGKQTIAHELAHVIQQEGNGGYLSDRLELTRASDSTEVEADVAAEQVTNGTPARVQLTAAPIIARQSHQNEEDPWRSPFNNPIWNATTNNALSGAVGLFENAGTAAELAAGGSRTLTTFESAAMSATSQLGLGPLPGLGGVASMNSALAAPARAMPQALMPQNSLGGLSRVGAALAPLGVISNAMSFADAIERPGSWLEKGGDAAASALGFASSAIGTVGLAGSGLSAAGATSVGGALTTATGAAGLGPAAAVMGAGAGGYALGRLLDQGVDWVGDTVSGNEQADHSISGALGDGLWSLDKMLSGAESDDDYRSTFGYRLSQWLDD